MKHTLLLSIILCVNLAFSQNESVIFIDVSGNISAPNHLIIPKASKEIIIDGIAESTWDYAPFTSNFIDIEGIKEVKFETKTKILWDNEFLYIYAELEEPHIWGDITQRDAIIYLNNDFEVFIDPSGKGEVYGEIELNALNTVWDLLLNKPYRAGGFANFHWNLDDMKTAVKVDGTINDPSDTDKKWMVEMAIPLRPLIELKNDKRQPIKEGDQWRLNFSRVEWDYDLDGDTYSRKKVDGKLLPEYNWVWSNQTMINMHAPEMWGVIQFTEKETIDNVEYIEDPDMELKQVLYALYRETRWRGKLAGIIPDEPLEEIAIDATYGNDKHLEATLLKTSLGFEISVKSDKTSGIYTINEQGQRTRRDSQEEEFTLATWAHGDKVMDDVKWNEKLDDYSSMGISEVLVGGSPEFLSDLVKLAKPKNIKIHAWMWTLNRPNDTIANKNPDWYAVNRNGENSLDYRAYVDYYQWLSPFSPEAREYIKDNVRKLLKVEGLASIHLDYVRYVDVILGADLQPKYDLVQTEEMPEYDYGYHPNAIAGFEELFGKNPLEMEHPELSTEWRQYRLNAVTSLVNEIAEIVHNEKQKLSAAVFPFPEMSRQMVRQAWDDWDLDEAYPMIYHNFYQENIDWIGFATEQGVNDVDFPINTGLYMPAFKTADELEQAIRLAKEKGAKGVSIFTADNLKDDLKEVLRKLNEE